MLTIVRNVAIAQTRTPITLSEVSCQSGADGARSLAITYRRLVSDLHQLSALEQAAAIASGRTSSLELVRHHLDRIADLDSRLGAFVHVCADAAVASARAADRTVRAGGTLPPLHGVPLAIKDLTATAGVPTSFGSAAYEGHVPEVDDDVVGFLAAAGTISLGKTSAPEFGLSCYTETRNGPPARTPHDLSRMAGGSSGGAAAAVAAGLVPFAQGTDGAGSLRIPAAMCGLVGLKTSRGLISRGPVGSDPLGMSVHGPLARTTADAAALLEVMQVPVLSEPFQAGRTTGLVAATRREPGRLRIARSLDTPIDGVVIDPEVRAAFDDTAALLSALGHEVVDLVLPDPPGMVPAFVTVWTALAHGMPIPPGGTALLMPLTRYLLDLGTSVSGPELARALGTVLAGGRILARAMSRFDAVLFPTVARLPPPVGYFSDTADPATDFARQLTFTPWTAQINVTGQPAINVPLQWTPTGLPIGMQFVGPAGSEPVLLALAGQLERARPWSDRTPEMW